MSFRFEVAPVDTVLHPCSLIPQTPPPFQTQIGTALFTAPEVFLNVAGHVYEGTAVDVWSCGVVLHMLLFGQHPFLTPADTRLGKAEQMVRLIENTVKGVLFVPPAAEATPVADLLRRILVPAPRQRYGVKEIMEHPWFQVGGSRRWWCGGCCDDCGGPLLLRRLAAGVSWLWLLYAEGSGGYGGCRLGCVRRVLGESRCSTRSLPSSAASAAAQTKLPPGALDLNSSYLPTSGHQAPRQTPDAIKQVIRSAVQLAGDPSVGVPAVASVPSASASDWPPDSPGWGGGDEASMQQRQGQASAGVPMVSSGGQLAGSSSQQQQQQQPRTACSGGQPAIPYQRLMSYSVVTTTTQSPRAATAAVSAAAAAAATSATGPSVQPQRQRQQHPQQQVYQNIREQGSAQPMQPMQSTQPMQSMQPMQQPMQPQQYNNLLDAFQQPHLLQFPAAGQQQQWGITALTPGTPMSAYNVRMRLDS